MIRIVIVAGIRLYREGLAQFFAQTRDLEVVGMAGDAPSSIETVIGTQPDVVLLDLALPEAIEAVRALKAAAPETCIVVLAVPEVESDVVALAEAGVSGYVTRDGSLDDLVAAIRSVACGETLCTPWIAATLLRRVAALAEGQRASPHRRLTSREAEVVALIDEGLSNKEIAQRLCIEVATVKNHLHHAFEKLGVERRTQAVALARRDGLLAAIPR